MKRIVGLIVFGGLMLGFANAQVEKPAK
ncbi:MAG: hypothetical protein RLZZ510_761, partial [Bacteroidota bacterium]